MADPAKTVGNIRKLIRAYHGSPHSFSRFDASKIGTGEGAQSYGHGLYFAGNEAVAREYRDRLKDLVDAPVPDEWGDELQAAIAEIRSLAERRSKLSGPVDFFGAKTPSAGEWNAIQKQLDDAHARHQVIQHRIREASRNPGHMYEVEIDAPEGELLDLDLPVQSQSQVVQDALGKYVEAPSWFSLGQEGWVGKHAYTRMAGDMADANPRIVGGYHVTHDQPAASAALLQGGVPGIRYLDQGSRVAGEGTRNYVMFPGTEGRIRILRQYGWMLPMAAAGIDGQDPGPP